MNSSHFSVLTTWKGIYLALIGMDGNCQPGDNYYTKGVPGCTFALQWTIATCFLLLFYASLIQNGTFWHDEKGYRGRDLIRTVWYDRVELILLCVSAVLEMDMREPDFLTLTWILKYTSPRNRHSNSLGSCTLLNQNSNTTKKNI